MWLWAAGEQERRAHEMAMLMSKSEKLSKEDKMKKEDKLEKEEMAYLSKMKSGMDSKEHLKIEAEVCVGSCLWVQLFMVIFLMSAWFSGTSSSILTDS